jgi:hypothetical protein
MEEVIQLREMLQEKLSMNLTKGERVYYDKKMQIFNGLIDTVLREATPSEEELEFYNLSFKVDELKKGDNKKLLEETEAKLAAVRAKVVKVPHKRLF